MTRHLRQDLQQGAPTRRARRRLLHFEQCEERLLLTAAPVEDISPEVAAHAVAADADPHVRYRFETTDRGGRVVDEVRVGDEFLLTLYVEDTRANPEGVFAAFLDVYFDPDKVATGSAIAFGEQFPNAQTAAVPAPGLIDEIGALGGLSGVPGEQVLWSIPFVATAAGDVTFQGDSPDIFPSSDSLVYGSNVAVERDRIEFGSTQLTVLASGAIPPHAVTPPSAGESFLQTSGLASPFVPLDSVSRLEVDDRGQASSTRSSATQNKASKPLLDTTVLRGEGGFAPIDLSPIISPGTNLVVNRQFTFNSNSSNGEVDEDGLPDALLMVEPTSSIERVAEDRMNFRGTASDFALDNVALRVTDGTAFEHDLDARFRAFSAEDLPEVLAAGLSGQDFYQFDLDLSPEELARITEDGRTNYSGNLKLFKDRGASETKEEDAPQAEQLAVSEGGFSNIAMLRNVEMSKRVDLPEVSSIQIAQARLPNQASQQMSAPAQTAVVADSTSQALAWELHVDQSRGVSLAFDIADTPLEQGAPASLPQPQPARPATGGREPVQHGAHGEETTVPAKDAVSMSRARTGDEDRSDRSQHAHYLSLSSVVIMAAGSLLVTDRWQKLQPRKSEPRE